MNFFLCPDTNFAFFQLKNLHGQVWKNSHLAKTSKNHGLMVFLNMSEEMFLSSTGFITGFQQCCYCSLLQEKQHRPYI